MTHHTMQMPEMQACIEACLNCFKGLTLFGAWYYNLNDFPAVMDVIERSPLMARLISHVLPISRIQGAFALSASHETAKVTLKPWE